MAVPGRPLDHSASRLEAVFNGLFADAEDTLLIGGQSEPWYQPGSPSRLFYREDYFASALHEAAHWCIAGVQRRRLPDFGYWYAPEGRDERQQEAFEAVETRPQAIEWYFSQACGFRFRVSADNLSPGGELRDNNRFKQAVVAAAWDMQQRGLPPRARQYFRALAEEFSQPIQPCSLQFDLAALC